MLEAGLMASVPAGAPTLTVGAVAHSVCGTPVPVCWDNYDDGGIMKMTMT